jgi:hypothetical integral membrane protein (TIGR02206 family)
VRPFVPFSREHFGAVAVWLVLTVGLVAAGRRLDERGRVRAARALAVVLVVYYAIESIVRVSILGMRVWDTLPFEMCSALFFIGAFGLWTGSVVALEVVWFWTMSGPIHALITPTPRAGFPDLNYFQYFFAHGLLVFTALFVTIALRKPPGRGAVMRSFVALVAFIPIVAVVDLASGENYLYLRHKPPSPTLVDALGPWPFYVGAGTGVALASFLVVSIPWLITRGRDPLPPGPRAPGIVQLMRFATKPFDFFDEQAAKFGDAFTVDMAAYGRFVIVSSPELVKKIFTADMNVMHAGKANRDLEPFVGSRSLLLLDGAEHLRIRRLIMPPFHGDRMRAYASMMAEKTRAAAENMPVGSAFAIHDTTQAIALEIILRAVFGLTHGAEKDRMQRALVDYLEPPSPVLMFLPKVSLPMTPYRKFLDRRDAVDREIFALIEARRGGDGDDILALLMAARDEDGKALTDQELRDELMTLLIAGHETTATSLAWAIERLASHPDVLARLVKEISACETPEMLVECAYLDAVVKESLRMRPIFPDVVREVQGPFVLGDFTLPDKTRVAPCIHLAHYREASWPNAKDFDPERFMPKDGSGVKIDPYTWFPFGGGTRRCPGMAFAMYEMKIVLGTLLQHVELRKGEAMRPVRRGVTLAPEGGARVTIDKRLA